MRSLDIKINLGNPAIFQFPNLLIFSIKKIFGYTTLQSHYKFFAKLQRINHILIYSAKKSIVKLRILCLKVLKFLFCLFLHYYRPKQSLSEEKNYSPQIR